MATLQVESPKKGNLVGTYVSPRVFSYFTLFTLAKGVSKSKIFKELFHDWISRQREIDSEADLLKQIVLRVRKTRSKLRNRDMDIEMFRKIINAELSAKSVSEEYIKLILDEIE